MLPNYAVYLDDCLKKGSPWPQDVCRVAALLGRLKSLQYLHECSCSWDVFTCRFAAISGHLDCLKYAHENGCPWDVHVCKLAEKQGHLSCLYYAFEHGCPWKKKDCPTLVARIHAATIFQRAWRCISNDPYRPLGRRVILRRFDELRN